MRFGVFLAASLLASGDAVAPMNNPRLVYSTYVGSGGNGSLGALAVDADGFAYVGGVAPGPEGSVCAFLTKLNQTGTGAIWTTCLPVDEVDSVTVDPEGFLYISGVTMSNGYQSLLMKLTPDGKQFIYQTALPGVAARKIALNSSGSLFATGLAGEAFKPTTGAFATGSAGQTFAARIGPTGDLRYATRLDLIAATGIAVDTSGNAWIVGSSCYNATGDPAVTCNPARTGTASAIRKLDAEGSRLLVTKTFGGGPATFQNGYSDHAYGVAVGAGETAWVVGYAHGLAAPTTLNGIVPVPPIGVTVPGYAVQFTASGSVQYGTYLLRGGSQTGIGTSAKSIVSDVAGSVFLGTGYGIVEFSSDGSTVLANDNGALYSAEALALDGAGGIYGVTQGCSNTTPGAYVPFSRALACAVKLDLTQQSSGRIVMQQNDASRLFSAAIAPGEMLLITGQGFPENPAVAFGGIPAPVVSSTSTSITAVVPFALAASWTVLAIDGIDVGINVLTTNYAPGLFAAKGSGRGQLDAYNHDGSANSAASPAAAGSIVTIFMTGAGMMVPAIADGSVGPLDPPYPTPLTPVFITVNGVPGQTVFAGQAPGKIAGVVRVDFRIPAETDSGDAVIRVGGGDVPIASTPQPTTTIVVR